MSNSLDRKQSVRYLYWSRPIGALEHHFQLSLTSHPLWGRKHLDVNSLSVEIAASRPCKRLEVIFSLDAKGRSPLSMVKSDWDVICVALSTYHGSSLTSFKFVGLRQEEMIHLLSSLHEETKRNVQVVEIVLSLNEFPRKTLQYLRHNVSFLRELYLLDPGSCVLLFRITDIREVIENLHHLRILVVEPRFVVASPEDKMTNRELDRLFYSTQQSVALENVVFSFVCAGQRPAKPTKSKPKTLVDLLKEPRGVTRRKEAMSAIAPRTVICPEFLSAGKERLQFALICNTLRRESIGDSTKVSNETQETLATIEASLRVVKDWMNQGSK